MKKTGQFIPTNPEQLKDERPWLVFFLGGPSCGDRELVDGDPPKAFLVVENSGAYIRCRSNFTDRTVGYRWYHESEDRFRSIIGK